MRNKSATCRILTAAYGIFDRNREKGSGPTNGAMRICGSSAWGNSPFGGRKNGSRLPLMSFPVKKYDFALIRKLNSSSLMPVGTLSSCENLKKPAIRRMPSSKTFQSSSLFILLIVTNGRV